MFDRRINLDLNIKLLHTMSRLSKLYKVAQKGVLGAYLFINFIFTCQHDQLVGVCSGRLKNVGPRCGYSLKWGGGLRCGSNSKRGVLGAGTYLY